MMDAKKKRQVLLYELSSEIAVALTTRTDVRPFSRIGADAIADCAVDIADAILARIDRDGEK